MDNVRLPKGFKTAGVSCGIKKQNKRDLALIVSENEAEAAGMCLQKCCKRTFA